MALSLYAALFPSFRQILAALPGVLDKAAAFAGEQGIDPDSLVEARLIETMLPLGYQVKASVGHSLGAIKGVRAGVYTPDLSAWPTDLAGLKALVADGLAELESIDPAEVEGFVGRPMRFSFRDRNMDFVAEEFLLSFSQPNFYFHATTAYDVLRARGVPLGKSDFMGRPRLIG